MQLHFIDRNSWRTWLQENHDTVSEIWMVFFKKHTGKLGVGYDEAVEEALCFGWVDSLIKRLDDDRYARKFTPRTNIAKWSESNLGRIQKLIKSGKMTEIGLAKVPSDVEALPPISERSLSMPKYFADALAGHPTAKQFFEDLAPSYRRNFIHWVCSAKREETRVRRLQEAIGLLAEGRKLGMK